MSQKIRSRGKQEPSRRSPVLNLRVLGNLASLLIILGLCVLGAVVSPRSPASPSQALAEGLQFITVQAFTPNIWLEFVILGLALLNTRSLWLELLAHRNNTPIEVRPLDNATGDKLLDTHRLDVAFRDNLALSRLYQIPTIPGDQEPDRLIDVLNAPADTGWRGVLGAVYAYTFPRRAFVVSASLRVRGEDEQCGVSVQVRKLPGLAFRLDSQWSTTFERALQRAAYAVAAHVIQQTRACRKVPWSEWRRRKRPIPASLFRDYQRAKRMVRERRYDEALALYHRALLQDAGNIGMRYDVGQLYERLKLFPDALFTYLSLTDEIFPATLADHRDGPVRAVKPTWRPNEVNRDPYIIRYRYLIVLGLGTPLARELAAPSARMSGWICQVQTQNLGSAAKSQLEERPWRATELVEFRRLLSERLDRLYFVYCHIVDKDIRETLADLLRTKKPKSSPMSGVDIRKIERYLLRCAEYEAKMLLKDVERLEKWSGRFRRRRKSVLTSTAVRQTLLNIHYRIDRLNAGRGSIFSSQAEMEQDLMGEARYLPEVSNNWLEHYNAACYYALAIIEDKEEIPKHKEFAFASVAALDRAAKCGDVVEFVTSKKYWLQAGDPDLAGLRCYSSFRAFEARIYGHPLPPTPDIAKYELYLFLRRVLQEAAGYLEDSWRKRAELSPQFVTYGEFEEWWRQESHAWELAIRVGRFFRQWQTRQSALEGLRNWFESYGPEFKPITYPDLIQPGYLPDVGDYSLIDNLLERTEQIFSFLGTECGSLVARDEAQTVYSKTRSWSRQAARRIDLNHSGPMSHPRAVEECLRRSAVWAGLRHWALSPGERQQRRFVEVIASLTEPD